MGRASQARKVARKKRTQRYYDENPDANRRRLKQQSAYQKTEKGKEIKKNANALNRKLGTYGNGDDLDASHYKGSKTEGRLQMASTNRRSRLKAKKSTKKEQPMAYASGRERLMAKQAARRKKRTESSKSVSKPTTASAQRKLNRKQQSERIANRVEEQKKTVKKQENKKLESKKTRESLIEQNRKRNARRGGGVKNRTDNPILGTKKKVTPSKPKKKRGYAGGALGRGIRR